MARIGLIFSLHAFVLFAPPDGGGATPEIKALETAVAELAPALKKVREEVTQFGDTLKTEIKALGQGTTETREKVDKALTQHTEFQGRITAVEQMIAGFRNGGGSRPKSVGQLFAESDAWKKFSEGGGRGEKRAVLEVAQLITSLTTDADGSAGDLIAPDRRSTLIMPQLRRMTVRQLLMPGSTTSNLVQYMQETGFTNAAGVQVTEGVAKEKSTVKFDLKSVPVITIAHWMHASKQVLDDAAQLRSHIDGRLRYGLMLKEEDELLNGDGTGGDITGVYTAATAYSAEFTPSDPTMIDTIRLAILQVALAEWGATGAVLNPIDWARIELTKDEEGRYIFSNPLNLAGPTLWGIPIVPTQAMTEDKFLVGAFTPAAQIFDREGVTVVASSEDRDNFVKNLITILAEQRLALAIYRPEALVKGDFGNVS